MTAPAGSSWWIGLPAWILQDGNYTDFETGERRQFALEWSYDRSKRLHRAAGPSRCAHTGRGVSYQVIGELLRAATEPMTDAFVLDFGLRAYTQWMVLDDLEPPSAGQWLTGEIGLFVDPFFYMDDLAALPGMPPLIHTWTIDEIQVQTDGSPVGWRTVPRTSTWDDVGYRLRCTLSDAEPVRSMAASGPGSPYGPLGSA